MRFLRVPLTQAVCVRAGVRPREHACAFFSRGGQRELAGARKILFKPFLRL